MLAERLDTIRQGADKRIPTDKRVRRMICARRASHGRHHQSGPSAAAFRAEERVWGGGVLVRASGQCAVGSDGVPQQLVTLLRRRAVCFAASGGYP